MALSTAADKRKPHQPLTAQVNEMDRPGFDVGARLAASDALVTTWQIALFKARAGGRNEG